MFSILSELSPSSYEGLFSYPLAYPNGRVYNGVMKTITRNINRFDEWSNSWFTDPVTEYEIVTKFYQWIADKLPKRLVFFCYIRFMAYVTTHGEGERMTPDEIGFSKAVEIWESYNH